MKKYQKLLMAVASGLLLWAAWPVRVHLETPFILFGKIIRKGHVLDYPMMQYDLPATLAYALGLQIPKEWRGRPMTEMFK